MTRRVGMTLIEIVVVMGIIAVIMVLTGTALKDVYDNYMADQIAENILTEIRDVQNKSLSVVNDGATSAKAWGVKIYAKPDTSSNPVKIEVLRYDSQEGSLGNVNPYLNKSVVNTVNLNATYVKLTNANAVEFTDESQAFTFNFSAPFAKPQYLIDGNDCVNYEGITQEESGVVNNGDTCVFVETKNFLKSWSVKRGETNPSATEIVTNDKPAKIEIKYGKSARTIYVKGNGEAYVG